MKFYYDIISEYNISEGSEGNYVFNSRGSQIEF